jgi:hypothetical protein
MSDRECTICGCDISALQFNRKRCLKESCITKQRQLQNAKKNKSTCKVTGASVRYRTGLGTLAMDPYSIAEHKVYRSSGGMNIARDVLDQQRREEWAWLNKKGVGK